MRRLLLRAILLSPAALALSAFSAFAQSSFVYTNNNHCPNSVSAFRIGADGGLTQIPGSPFATGGDGAGGYFAPARIVAAQTGNFLYVLNSASHDITVFRVDPASGALAAAPGSPFAFAGADAGSSLAVTPNNRFLIAASFQSGTATVYAVDANGSLTLVSAPVPTAREPLNVKVSPDGRFVAFVHLFPGAVSMFAIDAAGTLTPVPGSPFAAYTAAEGSGPASIDFTRNGQRAFVGLGIVDPSGVEAYSVAANGTLTRVPNSPFFFDDADNSNVVTTSLDGQFLFVSNQFSNMISTYRIAADGQLSAIPGSPCASGGGQPDTIALERQGRFLYAADEGGNVDAFVVGADGVLTQVPGSPFPVGLGTAVQSLAVFPPKPVAPPPETVCLLGDATGDTFSIVVQAGDPRYGQWTYRIAATGQVITGTASTVRYIRGRSLVAADDDYSAENPLCWMSATVDFARNTGTVQVRIMGSPTSIVLRDRNLRDDPPCS